MFRSADSRVSISVRRGRETPTTCRTTRRGPPMSPPIRLNEFLAAIAKSAPPRGWLRHPKIGEQPSSIRDSLTATASPAVANSGGPDSTCLLFLLSEAKKMPGLRQPLPFSVVSVHVNHNLQRASSAMATRAASTASLLGCEHLVLDIPWGESPFPARPHPDVPFEKFAREARYHVIFNAMTTSGATTVAFGHHADDQVETSLIRLSKGSTNIGAAGMRRCRRWGMGSGSSEDALGWVGQHGMTRFIIRPLLDFSKVACFLCRPHRY